MLGASLCLQCPFPVSLHIQPRLSFKFLEDTRSVKIFIHTRFNSLHSPLVLYYTGVPFFFWFQNYFLKQVILLKVVVMFQGLRISGGGARI